MTEDEKGQGWKQMKEVQQGQMMMRADEKRWIRKKDKKKDDFFFLNWMIEDKT